MVRKNRPLKKEFDKKMCSNDNITFDKWNRVFIPYSHTVKGSAENIVT
jgi:hypothetical protein